MLTTLKQLWKDEEGPTAVEYALMVALIAIAIMAAVTAMSGGISNLFTEMGTRLTNAN